MSAVAAPWQLSREELLQIAQKARAGKQPATVDKPAGKSSDVGHTQDAPDKDRTGPDWQLDPALWDEILSIIPDEKPATLPMFIGTIDGGIKVYLVDGNEVKVKHDMEYVEAGNGVEAPEFIPRDEIWLDASTLR